jgi:hypothetical protein
MTICHPPGRVNLKHLERIWIDSAESFSCSDSLNGLGHCVSLLREPEAGNPHIRFDERGVETAAWSG